MGKWETIDLWGSLSTPVDKLPQRSLIRSLITQTNPKISYLAISMRKILHIITNYHA